MGYIIVVKNAQEDVHNLIQVALDFESDKYEMEGVIIENETPCINVCGYPSTLHFEEN